MQGENLFSVPKHPSVSWDTSDFKSQALFLPSSYSFVEAFHWKCKHQIPPLLQYSAPSPLLPHSFLCSPYWFLHFEEQLQDFANFSFPPQETGLSTTQR